MGCSFHKWGCFTDLQTGILGQCPVNARPHSAVYGHRLGKKKNLWYICQCIIISGYVWYITLYIYISILIIIHCGYVHDIWLKIAYTWCHLGWLPGYHSHLSIDVTAWGPITYPSIVCVYIYIFIHVIYICISMCINLHIVSHEVSIPSIHRLSLNIPISLAI